MTPMVVSRRPATYAGSSASLAYSYLAREEFTAARAPPGLRGAIDEVIHLCNTTHADFNGGFTLDDYPTYQAQPFRQQPTTRAETYY